MWNKLNNEETVARSRQFPFRFFSAYEAIDINIEKLRQDIKEAKQAGAKTGQKSIAGGKKSPKGKGAKPAAKPKKVIVPKNMPDEALITKYKEALDNAVKYATVRNVKPIRGSTVVFCNISDAMTENCKSANGMGSVRTTMDVAVLLGLMCKFMCEESDFRICAAPGRHSACHLPVDLIPGTILDNMKVVTELARSGQLSTASFDFPFDYLEELIREKKVIDNLIVLSNTMVGPGYNDMTHLNPSGVSGMLKKYRQDVNPDLLFVSVNLGSTGRSIDQPAEDKHPNDVLISGFSDAILRYIAERGDSNQLHYIDHIDQEKGIKELPARTRKTSNSFSTFGTRSYSNPFRSRVSLPKKSYLGSTFSFFDDDEKEAEKTDAIDAQERERKAQEDREIEEQELRRVAEQVQKVRSGKWRCARVFLSSTFRDMHGERDYLSRFVFPELRHRCKQKQIHFYDIDLRWGVTQEQAEDVGALSICLNEVDQCRPFFIGLLGERYGLRLDEYKLPDEPRYHWAKNYPKGRSVTELEMYYGALRNAQDTEAFFYMRDNSFISAITEERYREDFVSEDNEARDRTLELKDTIARQFPRNTRTYKPSWAGVVDGKPMTGSLQEFGRNVLEDLWSAICRTFPDAGPKPSDDPLGLALAQDYHHAFMEAHTRAFVGREDSLKVWNIFPPFPCLSSS